MRESVGALFYQQNPAGAVDSCSLRQGLGESTYPYKDSYSARVGSSPCSSCIPRVRVRVLR